MSACGTRAAEESLPVNAMEAPREASEETTEAVETADETAENAEAEPERQPLPPASDNFATPHHCHPPGPCELNFETLAGVQYVDVGHGHASAPQLDVVLSVGGGRAQVEQLAADAEAEADGSVEGRPRSSLEGNAYYVAVDGEASDVVLRIGFSE